MKSLYAASIDFFEAQQNFLFHEESGWEHIKHRVELWFCFFLQLYMDGGAWWATFHGGLKELDET